jgi:hypothetical protein
MKGEARLSFARGSQTGLPSSTPERSANKKPGVQKPLLIALRPEFWAELPKIAPKKVQLSAIK